MTKHLLLFLLALSFVKALAQPQTYLFTNTLAESSNNGPALTSVLATTCAGGIVSGGFTTSIINTSTGNCGSSAKQVYGFNQHEGFSYANGLVSGTYTIHMLFSFDAVSGYRRIIDFKEGVTDAGLYILNGALNFYPNGNQGPANSFVANTFYLLTLVRNDATSQIQIYVNGVPFVNYTDLAGDYKAASTATPIILIRDNVMAGGQCENAAGKIKYFSIDSTIATAASVTATYLNICAIALPVKLSHFIVSSTDAGNELQWTTSAEAQMSRFVIQRSTDARAWADLGTVADNGRTQYQFTDAAPLAGDNYYRLQMHEANGAESYTTTVLQRNKGGNDLIKIYPNPANNQLTITRASRNATSATVYDMQGRLQSNFIIENTYQLDIHTWPAGIYNLHIDGLVLRLRKN